MDPRSNIFPTEEENLKQTVADVAERNARYHCLRSQRPPPYPGKPSCTVMQMAKYSRIQLERRVRSARRQVRQRQRFGRRKRATLQKREQLSRFPPIYLSRRILTQLDRFPNLASLPLKTTAIFHSSNRPESCSHWNENTEYAFVNSEGDPSNEVTSYFQHECSCTWLAMGGYGNGGQPDLTLEWGLGGLAWKALEFLPGDLDYEIRLTPDSANPRTCGHLWRAIRLGDEYTPAGRTPTVASIIGVDVESGERALMSGARR